MACSLLVRLRSDPPRAERVASIGKQHTVSRRARAAVSREVDDVLRSRSVRRTVRAGLPTGNIEDCESLARTCAGHSEWHRHPAHPLSLLKAAGVAETRSGHFSPTRLSGLLRLDRMIASRLSIRSAASCGTSSHCCTAGDGENEVRRLSDPGDHALYERTSADKVPSFRPHGSCLPEWIRQALVPAQYR
jgi:hypothetical protein